MTKSKVASVLAVILVVIATGLFFTSWHQNTPKKHQQTPQTIPITHVEPVVAPENNGNELHDHGAQFLINNKDIIESWENGIDVSFPVNVTALTQNLVNPF